MSGEAPTGPGARARPVADAPIDGLIDRAHELSKRWVLALVRASPLEEIAMLQLAPIARTGPSLCAQVLRALRSDTALDSELPEAAEPGAGPAAHAPAQLRLPWAGDPREAVIAVEALRRVLWDALVHSVGAAHPYASDRLLSDLADRLAHVCSAVLERSLPPTERLAAHSAPADGESAPRRRVAPRVQPTPPAGETRSAPEAQGERHDRASRAEPAALQASDQRPQPPGAGASAGAARARAVLVDEYIEASPARDPSSGFGRQAPTRQSEPRATRRRPPRPDGRALPWEIPLAGTQQSQQHEPGREHPASRADGPEPSISVTRRRPPRERE